MLGPDWLARRQAREASERLAEARGDCTQPTIPGTKPRQEVPGDPAMSRAAGQFLLWIDGVGGYLICLGNRITIGQATPDAPVDIPVFADVSRHHATLTRDPEGYLLEAVHKVQVNGQAASRTLLHSGDRLTLGSSCQFQFHQPVPVSASAVLKLVSGQRLRLAVDAVLLMADTLVLGPGPQAHVLVPDLGQPVILYRHAREGLGIRCPGNVLVNGQVLPQRGAIEPGTIVAGEDFSLALEAVQ